MKKGDLVFMHGGAADQYKYTVPASWGYVVKPEDEGYVLVEFHHYGEGSEEERDPDPERTWGIEPCFLCVLPEPPETKEEITALVFALTKVTA